MPGADLFDKLVSNLNKDGTTSIVKTSTNPPNNKKDAPPPPKQSKEASKAMNSKPKESNNEDMGNGGPPPAKKPAKNKKIEEIYQKKTQLEHILLRPDTYIGSVELVKETMWVVDDGKVDQREVQYVPGLYKIFDEILVNAADNKQRDSKMDCIKIDIDPENNKVSIWNNGQGIPVQMHSEEKMYVPTLIFGHLLTSSNFDDEEEKVTGGRNGYGAKLCNVFSNKFTVETANKKSKRAFKQTWQDNMSKAGEPKVKEYSGEDYTKITFEPDLTKFKMESLDPDIVSIFHRRAYDIAATSGCKVFLNGKRLPVKNFKDYVDMYLKERKDDAGNAVKFQYEKVNERWEVACCLSENGFQQVSFVNSIATTKGGKHTDHVADNLVKSLAEAIKKKNKNGVEMKPSQIKNHLWLFVNCLVVNPTFDSQTKEFMTLQAGKFGSKCVTSEKFTAAVIKSGIVEACVNWAKYKAEEKLGRMQKGTKKIKITGIPKLEDANEAGRSNSLSCTLILTEGDSAKTLAVAGLGVVGRDHYGVFPLRGKLLNVREASSKQIMDNAEISALVKILGLQYKKKYDSHEDMKGLRYGKLMIMTDQDHDGSHIKGLIINFIHHNWPGLLKMNFIEEFITPIVKASKGKNTSVPFFSMPELEEWKKNTPNWKQWKIKYYKGLGTSTSVEAKEYFSDMQRHRIKFKYLGKNDDDNITMAFSKKCIEQRKDWLTNWMETTKARREMGMAEDIIYSKDVRSITYTEFINKELVLFSNLDNSRSIPSLVDGLKPGQRKVVFTCLKRNDKREVKVAQLAGSVAEHSAYHHGEQSLMSTIIGLAQNYVGSNNINILQPIGQFGTRLQGGKDAASPRYIFTQLSPLAKDIFNPKDAPLLNTLFDDSQRIEPEYYVPLIPMVLVNGADGIGTGWMTKIPNFNPREIVANIRRMIEGQDPVRMKPWYKGFQGEIVEISGQKYACNGEVSILHHGRDIEITELPVGTWTQTYKESVMEVYSNGTDKIPALINDYKEYHTDTTVKFLVSMKEDQFRKHENEGFHKSFKLQSSINLTSMVLFDRMGCLKRYDSVDDILREFFDIRMGFYEKRREYMLGLLEAEASKLSNQARFILEKCDNKLSIENKKRKVMVQELISKKYDPDPVAVWKEKQEKLNLEEDEDDAQEDAEEEDDENETDEEKKKRKKTKDDGEALDPQAKMYDYLLGMKLWSLTLESKERLLRERDSKIKELEDLKKKSPRDLYRDDLNVFIDKLDETERLEREEVSQSGKKNKKAVAAQGKGGAKGGRVARAMVAEYAPSPRGERIAPRIDEMIKKAEAADKAKENKGKGRTKKVKDEPIERDEFDMLADEANSSLREVLDSSTDDVKPALAKGKANGAAAAKKPAGTKDGLKQTKLTFGKAKKGASPKKKGKKKGSDSEEEDEMSSADDSDIIMDSDEDVKPQPSKSSKAPAPKKAPAKKAPASPAKRKKGVISDSEDDEEFSPSPKKKKGASPKKSGSGGKKKKAGSDSEESIVLDDGFSDEESFRPSKPSTDRVRRTAAVQKKYVFDDDEESDPFKSSGGESD